MASSLTNALDRIDIDPGGSIPNLVATEHLNPTPSGEHTRAYKMVQIPLRLFLSLFVFDSHPTLKRVSKIPAGHLRRITRSSKHQVSTNGDTMCGKRKYTLGCHCIEYQLKHCDNAIKKGTPNGEVTVPCGSGEPPAPQTAVLNNNYCKTPGHNPHATYKDRSFDHWNNDDMHEAYHKSQAK